MIVLETNVISELMRAEPHPAVLAWVAAQPRPLLYTTHINQAEILYGIAALPEGRRRASFTRSWARNSTVWAPAGASSKLIRQPEISGFGCATVLLIPP
jgi:predicted nucleic acid-binding protein